MPQRKKPKSLEAASLESIGENIFLATLSRATQDILHQYLLEQLDDASFESKYSRYEVEEILSELELNKLCLGTPDKWKVCNQNKSLFVTRSIPAALLMFSQSGIVTFGKVTFSRCRKVECSEKPHRGAQRNHIAPGTPQKTTPGSTSALRHGTGAMANN